LKELHVAGTNYIMALPDRDRFGDLLDKSWVGAMPYTLIIAPGGKVLYRRGGAIDPLEVKRKGEEFEGAPAYQLYIRGADELDYQLTHNPVTVKNQQRISPASYEAIKVVLEEAAASEAMALEKGMIVLSTAVAGGPFIGLLGTVWGVMSTFAGIAEAHSASLTAMAPGVAAALIATVVGLLVAIPAMFGYNFMVTTIRMITQELDGFASRFANQIEHNYVDNRPLSEEIRNANEVLATRITEALRGNSAETRELAGYADDK